MKKRLCVSCHTLKDKDDLIKITKTKNGEILICPDSKQMGRSVYFCKNKLCAELFIKKCKIDKLLKTDDKNADKILREIAQNIDTYLP